MDVPSTRAELAIAERAILSEQLRILKVRARSTRCLLVFNFFQFFMAVLQDPEAVRYLETQQHSRDAEVMPQTASGQVVTDEPHLNTSGSEADPEEDNPDAVYEISPPKAALYSENVKGFGEWKINVTENANSQIRKLRKRSPETLRLVMKKIQYAFQVHSFSSLDECSPSSRLGTFRVATFRLIIKSSFPTLKMQCQFSRRTSQETPV